MRCREGAFVGRRNSRELRSDGRLAVAPPGPRPGQRRDCRVAIPAGIPPRLELRASHSCTAVETSGTPPHPRPGSGAPNRLLLKLRIGGDPRAGRGEAYRILRAQKPMNTLLRRPDHPGTAEDPSRGTVCCNAPGIKCGSNSAERAVQIKASKRKKNDAGESWHRCFRRHVEPAWTKFGKVSARQRCFEKPGAGPARRWDGQFKSRCRQEHAFQTPDLASDLFQAKFAGFVVAGEWIPRCVRARGSGAYGRYDSRLRGQDDRGSIGVGPTFRAAGTLWAREWSCRPCSTRH